MINALQTMHGLGPLMPGFQVSKGLSMAGWGWLGFE